MPSPTQLSNKTSPDPGAFGECRPLTRTGSGESGKSLGADAGVKPDGHLSGIGGAAAVTAATNDASYPVSQPKRDAMGLHQEVKHPSHVSFGDHYPDGGWGWVVLAAATAVHILCNGINLAYGSLFITIERNFHLADLATAWHGSLGFAVSLLIAPIVTTICRRKSPRLYGVIGGLICALGCLFLAFSNQIDQLFISYCLIMSLGCGVTMATANIMVGRYFRQKRELAEMILVAGSGVGAAVMSTLFHELTRVLNWMHGLQCVAGLLVLTIIASALYRSANLYHPRRKVILHLKSQKKNRRDREAEKPPYLDFCALKMRSMKALIVISAVIGVGIHVPFVLLVKTAQVNKEESARLFLLSVYLGLGFVVGCVGLGYITIRNSSDCYISRRHLCQTSAILCGLFTLLLILASDESSHALYAWAFGICCGSYYYSLKIYVYELVKIKLMERAWSFLSASNSFPILFGVPAASYLNYVYQSQAAGYIFAGVAMILGGLLFYAMPIFERHPSNNEILEKHSSCLYSATMNEAVALLDIDFSEGGVSGKQPQLANNGHAPQKNSKNSSSNSSNGIEDGGVKVQLQCFVQHRERDKPKQAILTKIAEEKDCLRSNGSVGDCCKRAGASSSSVNQTVELSVTKDDYSEPTTQRPSDSSFFHLSERSCKDSTGGGSGYEKLENKKSKKSEVRIDLFDPPSQEKESTATVSYDSDLYINLCEAQV